MTASLETLREPNVLIIIPELTVNPNPPCPERGIETVSAVHRFYFDPVRALCNQSHACFSIYFSGNVLK